MLRIVPIEIEAARTLAPAQGMAALTPPDIERFAVLLEDGGPSPCPPGMASGAATGGNGTALKNDGAASAQRLFLPVSLASVPGDTKLVALARLALPAAGPAPHGSAKASGHAAGHTGLGMSNDVPVAVAPNPATSGAIASGAAAFRGNLVTPPVYGTTFSPLMQIAAGAVPLTATGRADAGTTGNGSRGTAPEGVSGPAAHAFALPVLPAVIDGHGPSHEAMRAVARDDDNHAAAGTHDNDDDSQRRQDAPESVSAARRAGMAPTGGEDADAGTSGAGLWVESATAHDMTPLLPPGNAAAGALSATPAHEDARSGRLSSDDTALDAGDRRDQSRLNEAPVTLFRPDHDMAHVLPGDVLPSCAPPISCILAPDIPLVSAILALPGLAGCEALDAAPAVACIPTPWSPDDADDVPAAWQEIHGEEAIQEDPSSPYEARGPPVRLPHTGSAGNGHGHTINLPKFCWNSPFRLAT